MLTVTRAQLFSFLEIGTDLDYEGFAEEVENPMDRATFDALKGCDLKQIVAAAEMSENHLGGDDLVMTVDGVLAALREGYAIATWYGPKTEALVVGYRPEQLTLTE